MKNYADLVTWVSQYFINPYLIPFKQNQRKLSVTKGFRDVLNDWRSCEATSWNKYKNTDRNILVLLLLLSGEMSRDSYSAHRTRQPIIYIMQNVRTDSVENIYGLLVKERGVLIGNAVKYLLATTLLQMEATVLQV